MKETKDLKLLKQKEDIFEKLQTASMKRSASKSKLKTEEFLDDPNLLVGKRIQHKVQDEKDSASVVQCICNKN